MNNFSKFSWIKSSWIIAIVLSLCACVTTPPRSVDNLCHIFTEKKRWHKHAVKSQEKWGTAIPVMMAIMRQESTFRHDVRPPRRKILWFFPGPRLSDAYGYAQAKKSTWQWYQDKTGRWGADRDDFADAIDFIGWYNRQSYQLTNIQRNDTYNLYLAYHEGHGGFKRQSFKRKTWLKNIAKKVTRTSQTYTQQYQSCEKRLKRNGWFG